MGRGRAKAKQTKVARELKYYSPDTDLSALERELHGSTTTFQPSTSDVDGDQDDGDDGDDWTQSDVGEYGKWAAGER